MKIFKIAAMVALMSTMQILHATTIDFSLETIGDKANGYTVSGVKFFDTVGAELNVNDFGNQSHGRALAVLDDDTSGIRMLFSDIENSLSLSFGNDDPGYSAPGDIALLRLFLGGVQVGQTTVTLNRNDLMDQTIGLTGINFDEAYFVYAASNFNPIGLIEVIDDITFTAVPEPSSVALLALGLAGFGALRRKNPAQHKS